MWSRSMAFERVFARVLSKLPEDDAIALAAQRDKVIQLLHKELLAEGLLVVREGGGAPTASTQSGDVVASLQKGVSPSLGAESLKDYACTVSCLLNDLNTVDSPPYSDQLFEATSVVTDENMFAIDDDAHGEEDNSASNKATEAAEGQGDTEEQRDNRWRNMAPQSECLVICSMGSVATKQMGAVPKLPSSDSDGDGMEKEVVEIPEMLNRCKLKHVVPVAPFAVEGEGRLRPVWVDDDKVSFSKEFYLVLLEDFLKQCRTPGAVIWFTGLSQSGTGDWVFRDGTISFEEIFDLYQIHFKHRVLHIISDCSFSGCWVLRATAALDNMGIPPCGHHTRECGVLFKIWVATEPDEQAKELHKVRHGVLHMDGSLRVRMWTPKGGPLRSYLHSAWITCSSKLNNCCSLRDFCANFGWIGQVKIKPSLIYLVRGKDKGRPAWHYVLVDEGKENAFKETVSSGTVDVAVYGKVIKSGWGKDPPDDVKNAIDSFFYY